MTTLYENNDFIMKSTGSCCDFIATIENKTNRVLHFTPLEKHDSFLPQSCDDFPFEDFDVPAGDWVGILANDCGYTVMEAIENGFFDCV